MAELTRQQKLIKFLFNVIPHHAVSRIAYYLTRIESPLVSSAIHWFVKKHQIDMSEADEPEIGYYPTFNDFFTRKLRDGVRPIASGKNIVASPCDGIVSQAGAIHHDTIMQAKGKGYGLVELLGGDKKIASKFVNGRFVTTYLAPHNYHRLHMPLDAKVVKLIHVPGKLFSVTDWTVNEIPRLYARNERLICYFRTPAGPMVMVMVGAMNVSAIETVWTGRIIPPRARRMNEYNYSHTKNIIGKGVEMGCFNMGSTCILLMLGNVRWAKGLTSGRNIKMGQAIGQFSIQAHL